MMIRLTITTTYAERAEPVVWQRDYPTWDEAFERIREAAEDDLRYATFHGTVAWESCNFDVAEVPA